MDHQMDTYAYLIPISLVSGFILFPLLYWLAKDSTDNDQKDK
jgi:nitrogen fixation-related uncharacterized protein